MHDLIPLSATSINGQSISTANARDIHAYLQVKSDYRNWFARRIETYQFLQGIDYTEYVSGEGPMKTIEHYVTLDMAKQLGMVERTEKGKAIRLYFIEQEKRALTQQAAQNQQPPPPLPSPKEQLALAREAALLLEDFGTLTERDKLMLSDVVRNAVFSGDQRLLGSGAVPRYGFSLAERVQTLGYQLSRKAQASIFPVLGKRIAAEYRRRYGSGSPKEARYIDGAQRDVAWYGSEDAAWIDPMIQGYLAQLPGIEA